MICWTLLLEDVSKSLQKFVKVFIKILINIKNEID